MAKQSDENRPIKVTERELIEGEQVVSVPIEQLHPFKNHPYKLGSREALDELAESISENGIVTPAIARPRRGGEYELISGHRRKEACMIAGVKTMPVIIRDMDDDTAIMVMVDSNNQRENLLPSEKAFAYQMRLEAVKRKAGRPPKNNCGQVGHKSRDTISETESGRQIQRFIRLTNLVQPLLDMVDESRIALSPAVELSYLSQDEQSTLLDAMREQDCTPSYSQAVKLKILHNEGKLNIETIYSLMAEPKANQREKITFQYERVRKYFPRSYTPKQIEDKIIDILEARQRKQQRNKDAPER